jgi:hypothetical protein
MYKTEKQMNLKKILILILSIIIVGLSIGYYKLYEINKSLTDSKNFSFDWSPSGEVLFGFWKNNNKLSNQNIDRNFDNNYELFHSYDIFGNLVQSSYDINENGVYEKHLIFNSVGENVGNSIDSDEDGAMDEFSLILDSNDELRFIDSDNDGRYEKVLFFDKKTNSKIERLIEEIIENNKP